MGVQNDETWNNHIKDVGGFLLVFNPGHMKSVKYRITQHWWGDEYGKPVKRGPAITGQS